MPLFIQVRDTATGEQIVFERIHPKTLREAKTTLDELRKKYGHPTIHNIRLLVEMYPEEGEGKQW